MSEWILPFKGRNKSSSINQNFLWKSNNIYIMDNHRAALWCWLQHVKEKEVYNVFHIDAHYDTANTIKSHEADSLQDISKINFSDYLDIEVQYDSGKIYPMIRWDNYLSLYQYLYADQIGEYLFATHGIGTPPSDNVEWDELQMVDLPKMMEDLILREDKKWIINIDLDYFFTKVDRGHIILHSEKYISTIFNAIKKSILDNKVLCLTISLSPECCGGWEPAESICSQLCDVLDVDFSLPK